ncbi:MAG: bifunctional DNA-binding transcriptional regulator/O6-methylguanine-DNA methyltransferase Ada [Pseudomonadota bacterium]
MSWPKAEAHRQWLEAAVAARQEEGRVFIAVVTTGIYCLPDCRARPPKPENVRFFSSMADAEAAGFRACKRCKPRMHGSDGLTQRIIDACQAIADSQSPPSLAALSAQAGVSAPQFQRSFKAVLGLSPKDYAAALRRARVACALRAAPTVTQALYDAGYNAAARFYAEAKQTLGMTPSAHRAGGKGQAIRFALAETALGSLLVAASDAGICMLALGDDPGALLQEMEAAYPQAELGAGDARFDAWAAQAAALADEPSRAKSLPLDIRGTAFQQRVWKALQAIPLGETRTYSQIAADIGAPKAVRAVASACAANQHSLAIPCHRVIRRDGGLGGYRWGVERKRALLLKEKAAATRKD